MSNILKPLAGIILLLCVAYLGYYFYDAYRERTLPELEARVIHLEDSRAGNSEFKEYLTSDSTQLRKRATLAIGRCGHPGAGGILESMLADPSIEVAATAAFAFGLTEESQYAAMLLDRAWDMPASVACKAVEAAGRLSDSTMRSEIDALESYLTHPAPEVREAAAFGLFHAGAKSKGTALLDLWEKERDPSVREAALYALARMGLKAGHEAYIESVSDQDPFVRAIALRGLAASKDPEAEQYHLIALNDANRHVVAQAIAGLQQIGGRKAYDACYRMLGSDHDEKITLALIDALRAIDVPLKPTDHIHDALNLSESPYVIGRALEVLAEINGGRMLASIDSLVMYHTNPRILAACATAYGLTEQPNLSSRLTKLWLHEDPLVRVAAYQQLVRVDSTNIDYHVREALNDSDYVVVYQALNTIMERKKRDYLPVLTTMMNNPAGTDVEIRRGIVEVASTLLAEEQPKQDTVVMQLLIAGLLDPSYVVRKDAADVYKAKLHEDQFGKVYPVKTRIDESDIADAIETYQRNPHAIILTEKGEIEIELLFTTAPLTVMNFVNLARDGFYEGLTFHRVIPNFVTQGGDPRGDGWGGPSYSIRCEYSDEPYIRGSVGMATSGKDTGGSQFFVCYTALPHLEARYTLFARVLSGMEVVDRITLGDVIETVRIREGQQL